MSGRREGKRERERKREDAVLETGCTCNACMHASHASAFTPGGTAATTITPAIGPQRVWGSDGSGGL